MIEKIPCCALIGNGSAMRKMLLKIINVDMDDNYHLEGHSYIDTLKQLFPDITIYTFCSYQKPNLYVAGFPEEADMVEFKLKYLTD
jgi:hypothetical protein